MVIQEYEGKGVLYVECCVVVFQYQGMVGWLGVVRQVFFFNVCVLYEFIVCMVYGSLVGGGGGLFIIED